MKHYALSIVIDTGYVVVRKMEALPTRHSQSNEGEIYLK